MEASDFGPGSPGRLIETVGGALAFVPDPLPGDLELDRPTVNFLVDAERAVAHLSGRTSQLLNPYLIGSPLLHREAILSSKIEGTFTTPEQLVLLEAGANTEALPAGRAPDSDTREVLNYVTAMQRGLRLLDKLPVCLRLIRQVHSVLMSGVRGDRERPGEFRKIQNWIGRRGEDIGHARFVPPPPAEMMRALEDFEIYLNSDRIVETSAKELPVLIRLALAHYQFETIHPFRDGNGRIGRLLIPLLLCTHKRINAPLLYLSSFFEAHRDEYMNLLLRVSQNGEWIPWVRFFLTGVSQCADESLKQVEGLEGLRQRYQNKFRAKRASGLLPKLIDHLFTSPSITISKAATLLGISHTAANNNIRKLEAAGVLRQVGSKTHQFFIASEITAFMHASGDTRRPQQRSEYVTQPQGGRP